MSPQTIDEEQYPIDESEAALDEITPSDQDNHQSTEDDGLAIAKNETRWVFWLRTFTALVLSAVAIAVCLIVYFQGRAAEEEDFEQAFGATAEKLVASFANNVKNRMQVVKNFGTDISSEAEGQWPFVTPKNYTVRADGVGRLSKLLMVGLVPRVLPENREAWDQYVNASFSWKYEGAAWFEGIPIEEVEMPNPFPTIFDVHNYRPPQPDQNPGPYGYFPLWTTWPPDRYFPHNFNLYANDQNKDAISMAYETGQVAFVESYDYWPHDGVEVNYDLRYESFKKSDGLNYRDDPFCLMFFPSKY